MIAALWGKRLRYRVVAHHKAVAAIIDDEAFGYAVNGVTQ
jgi:hypothetical protein